MIKQVVFVVEDKIHPNEFLQIDKIYDVVHESDYMYYIDNGIGGQNSYFKNRFVTLQEWRDSKINKILNK